MATITSNRPVPLDYNPPQIRHVVARLADGEKPQRVTYDEFPLYADDPLRDSHALLDAYFKEAGCGLAAWDAKPDTLAAGRAILATPKDQWGAHLRAALTRILFYWTHCVEEEKHGVWEGATMWRYDDDGRRNALRELVPALLRGDPPLTEAEMAEIVDARRAPGQAGSDVQTYFRIDDVIRAAEKLLERAGFTTTVRDVLVALRDERRGMIGYGNRIERDRVRRLDDLLGETTDERKQLLDRGEPWADAVMDAVQASGGAESAWARLLRYCGGGDGSKPSGKWLKEAKKLIDALGAAEFSRCAVEWLTLAAQPRTRPLRDDQVAMIWRARYDVYSEKNETVLKGLAWACAAAADAKLAGPLGALAEWCYKKIPELGPRSPKVGNACLVALIALPGQEPRAELSRLKAKVKQPTARKMIEKAIGASAVAAGMTPDDLEELAVGTYGLTEVGRGEQKIGGYTVETRIAGTTKVSLTFADAKGKSRASVPADLKASHADDVKAVEQSCKDLAKMLPALRDRLERLPMNRRELPLLAWRTRYIDHPVVATLARRLIWEFVDGADHAVAGVWLNGKLVNADGKPLAKLDEETTRVRLWHPVGCAPDDVLAWRTFLSRHEITQPFKQAHREVYLLTDAERTTRTYSNRFAAHVLRQHQFAALCTQRGWKYRLMGSWDGGGDAVPTLELPRWNLRVEYWLSGGEGGTPGSGVAQFVLTDQVRFYDAASGTLLQLDAVPPLAFSEVMRDVDLFVGVASAGNDPNWSPAGNRVGNYWQSYTFGELSATAETRREVLAQLLPRLKIADRASLSDKFLVVRGDLRSYKIHLGSGNILMTPNDQYLCIVPDSSNARGWSAGDVLLPFEGDQMLSIILSKAFLLAGDAKITDPTIITQIERH